MGRRPALGARLGPSYHGVTAAGLGHDGARAATAAELDRVPAAVLTGFRMTMESPEVDAVHTRLTVLEPALLGFGYEGAVMATCLQDAITGGARTRELLRDDAAAPHAYLVLIGAGFALAKLPRVAWGRALAGLDALDLHPSLRWLALDGYGFDLAYFDRDRWLGRRDRHRDTSWAGSSGTVPRVVDQGIGRALWFAHAARAQEVADAVEGFAPDRADDLWSGVGLAATVAGGADATALRDLAVRAGRHRPHLALGSALGAKARHHSGLVPEATSTATAALTGHDVGHVSAVIDALIPSSGQSDTGAAYLQWRNQIRLTLQQRNPAEALLPRAA